MENILVMGDDRNLGEFLIQYLTPEGFRVDRAQDRETGIEMALDQGYSLIIVDVMLSGGDNDFSVLQHIRSRGSTPMIVLSARADDGDRIAGLEMGADDYLPKPFNPRELVARIRAVLRRTRLEGKHRTPPQIPKRLSVGDVEIDTGTRVVLRSGKKIALTSVEFSVLEVLLRNAGRLVSRGELMPAALGRSFSAYDRSIDVHVSKLRKKLGYKVSGMERIKAIRGEGYLYALTYGLDNDSVA
ncbi:MAG: response regulator transcription factor [Deltaproteobacteria bacterium]|nr:response regulator transcription factor [Deltaproteobacteria bacterium]